MTDEELIEVLWSISMSDHLGDVAEAIEPILGKFGLSVMGLSDLHQELKKRDLMPDYARADYAREEAGQ
jgi:hypothetical protein